MENDDLWSMMKKQTTPLINSRKVELINDRFLVKASICSTDELNRTILLVVLDLVGNNFKMHYYNNELEATTFLKLLKSL